MSPNDLKEEVKYTLDECIKRKKLLAVGSSSKNAKFILQQLDITEYFSCISDGTNISKSKPDPEVFLSAAKMLNLPVQECLVVEDAKAGIEAAYRGGFKSAGLSEAKLHPHVTYAFNTNEDTKIVDRNVKKYFFISPPKGHKNLLLIIE